MTVRFPLPVQAVTIDLDGTLLDTIPDLAAAANLMLRELERAPLDEALVRTFVGKGIQNLVERVLAAAFDGTAAGLLPRALSIYEQCYESVNGRHTTIYPGVVQGLDVLRARGFELACVTNKSTRFTLPLLAHVGLAPYFREVVAGDTLPRKKPDPLPLTHACERLGVAPRAMLVIGDSVNDALAARAAGCPVFCVDYGYNEGRDVRELDIDAIVGSLIEATRLIQKA